VLPAELQHSDGADEIVIQQLKRTHPGSGAGENAGLGGAVDHPVHLGDFGEVGRTANIALHDFDSLGEERRQIGAAAFAEKIVEPPDFDPGKVFRQLPSQGRTDKPTGPRQENFHGINMSRLLPSSKALVAGICG